MGKLDELMRSGGTNMAESIGKDVGRGPGSPPLATSSTPTRWQGVTKSKGAVEVPVEKLHGDPNQPREEFDEAALGRLAESIRTRGQLQPIRVRWDEGRGAYVIIAGERRWRAARMAGLATISAVVVDGEMSPAEEARAFESRSRRFFTRWNSEVESTYSSLSGKRATRSRVAFMRSTDCGCDSKSFEKVPGFFLFFAASFSNIVDIAFGSYPAAHMYWTPSRSASDSAPRLNFMKPSSAPNCAPWLMSMPPRPPRKIEPASRPISASMPLA